MLKNIHTITDTEKERNKPKKQTKWQADGRTYRWTDKISYLYRKHKIQRVWSHYLSPGNRKTLSRSK